MNFVKNKIDKIITSYKSLVLISIVLTSNLNLFPQPSEDNELELYHLIDLVKNLTESESFEKVINILQPIEPEIISNNDLVLKRLYYSYYANALLTKGNYPDAFHAYEEEAKYNINEIESLLTAANIALTKLGDYKKAESTARLALIKYIGNEVIGSNTNKNSISRLVYILGLCYFNKGQTKMLEECLRFHTSLNVPEQHELNEHLFELINSINNKEEACPISNDLIYIDSLILLKNNYSLKFDANDSITIKDELDKYNKLTEENVVEYIKNVNKLDSVYWERNDIYNSKRHLENAINRINRENIFIGNSIEGIALMCHMAEINYHFTEYDESLEWLLIAKNFSYNNNIQPYIILDILQRLSNIYHEKQNLFWSTLFIEEAYKLLSDLSKYYGKKNNDLTFRILSNYAQNLNEQSKYTDAERIFRNLLIDVTKGIFNNSNIELSFLLNNYATLLDKSNRFEEAIYYYENSIKLFNNIVFMENYLIGCIKNGDSKKSQELFLQTISHRFQDIIKSSLSFTELELENWLKDTLFKLYIDSNCIAYKINSEESLKAGFDATIFSKSFYNNFHNLRRSYIKENVDSSTVNLYSGLMDFREKLSKININNIYERDSLINDIKLIEDELNSYIKDNFIGYLENNWKFYDEISNSLTGDDAVIEFIELFDLLSEQLNPKFAAYIITSDLNSPLLIELCPFDAISAEISNIIKDPDLINLCYTQNNSKLYTQIWKPIYPYIKDKKNIYYSTSAALSYLNHDIICDEAGSLLGNKFKMKRITSSTYLSDMKSQSQICIKSAVLYGGIDYDKVQNDIRIDKLTSQSMSNLIIDPKVLNNNLYFRTGWNPIPNSLIEIQNISNLMNKKKIDNFLYTNVSATEVSFKALSYDSPDLLHCATHGFSYNRKISDYLFNFSPYSKKIDEMNLTGLLLSGANKIGIKIDEYNDVEDGILSSAEISRLDLSNTKMVVLSACETGDGSLDLIGNINGLQSAFKQAGVGSIVMSLWKVADEPTSILMTYFYEELLSGKERHEALKIAQNKVREIYPDPYYWGAFVILD